MSQELKQFNQLKQEVEQTYKQSHPSCSRPLQDWRGQDIVNFQEDLQHAVKGRISEKWFYTHMKAKVSERLPRIDMLNLLSQYAGYRHWQDFQFQSKVVVQTASQSDHKVAKKPLRLGKLGLLLGMLLISGLGIWFVSFTGQTYRCCFVDATTGQPITDPSPEILLLQEGESPRRVSADSKGCFRLKPKHDQVHFVVSAPYYHTDTIMRSMSSDLREEEIGLRSDDYALMIHYFSTDNMRDWEKRRTQLESVFSDKARIFQLSPHNMRGMEMYNKVEFIDKLTTPLQSLGQIEVLETIYEDEKIINLRFIQKESK